MNKIVTFTVFMVQILSTTFLNADEIKEKKLTSSYTSIAEKDCITLDSDDLGSIQECEPFFNIRVKVIEGDIRQSITLIRANKEYDLSFSSTITSAFSSLGSKIEWLYEVDKPDNLKGMIVRLNANEDMENTEHLTTFLVVSKITLDKICVIGKILPQENQNQVAKAMLENVNELPCLKDRNKN